MATRKRVSIRVGWWHHQSVNTDLFVLETVFVKGVGVIADEAANPCLTVQWSKWPIVQRIWGQYKMTKGGDERDNEERDKSYYSWPNGLGIIKLVRTTKNTCAEFWYEIFDSEMKEDSTSIPISLDMKTCIISGVCDPKKKRRVRGSMGGLGWCDRFE